MVVYFDADIKEPALLGDWEAGCEPAQRVNDLFRICCTHFNRNRMPQYNFIERQSRVAVPSMPPGAGTACVKET